MSSREIHKEWCRHINAASTHDEAIQTFALAIERQALERAAQHFDGKDHVLGCDEIAYALRALVQDASSEKEE